MALVIDRTTPTPLSRLTSFARECAVVLLLCSATLLVYTWYADFEIATADGIKWIPILFSVSPVLFLYILLRLALGARIAAVATFIITGILIAINDYKAALTGAPLSWSDMSNTDNIAMSSTFLSPWLLCGLAAATLILCIVLLRVSRQRLARRTWRSVMWHVAALLALSPLAWQPYIVDVSPRADAKWMDILNRHGIMYFSWDWAENIRMNGLPMHLVQTSHRKMPAMPTDEQHASLMSLPTMTDIPAAPRHVFFVLCEACWYDDAHFTDAVAPLAQQGLVPIRGISPAYGGGTANAAFEMLTSLPSRGALQGIIYQEYAATMADQTWTIPSMLKDQGYRTFALHNFTRTFWQRDVIMNKLGFDEFKGIEDMPYDGPTYYPRDKVLFDSALDILKRHRNDKAFFHLETVYSHASYDKDGDDGEGDFAKRLSVTMKDLASFIAQVRKISPDALFVIYADHKPILTKFFYVRGILPEDMFIATGNDNGDFSFAHHANQDILGDVPVWIGSPNTALVQDVVRTASNTPFYCIAAAIDDTFLASQHPASRYANVNGCRDYAPGMYKATAKAIPAWLYAMSLFDSNNRFPAPPTTLE